MKKWRLPRDPSPGSSGRQKGCNVLDGECKMETIRFDITNETEHEDGLRVIVLSGPVEYTPEFGMYRVPEDILVLLDTKGIRYEVIKSNHSGKTTT